LEFSHLVTVTFADVDTWIDGLWPGAQSHQQERMNCDCKRLIL